MLVCKLRMLVYNALRAAMLRRGVAALVPVPLPLQSGVAFNPCEEPLSSVNKTTFLLKSTL